jgi:FKBP-type peptidyl-prolyl cis-trans isomerase
MEINKEGKMFMGLIVAIVLVIVGVYEYTGAPSADETKKEEPTATSTTATSTVQSGIKQTNKPMNGLEIIDEVVGTGTEAVAGKTVSVHYVGTLTNGKKFDSSRDRGTPFSFNLGAGEVIKGWDQGVAGMKVGGKRKLTIAPELAYGSREVGGGLIPANSTLVFEVELLDIK